MPDLCSPARAAPVLQAPLLAGSHVTMRLIALTVLAIPATTLDARGGCFLALSLFVCLRSANFPLFSPKLLRYASCPETPVPQSLYLACLLPQEEPWSVNRPSGWITARASTVTCDDHCSCEKRDWRQSCL